MLIKIRHEDGAPLFEQIAAQLRRCIAEGEVGAGQRLPAARKLAESLEVNVHTVLRAYDALRGEGLVEMRRGRGVTVASGAPDRTKLMELARALVCEGRRLGLDQWELKKLLEEV